MKELHNHIFSNTTCISKETMLKFINKQLSKQELYEVEKHMLDCELCSDAYEGIAFAENSSMLFAIDSQIDQRAGVAKVTTPIMRTLMVAASLLVIVFGTYFTVNFFNQALENENNLAVNEVEEQQADPFTGEALTNSQQEKSENKNIEQPKEVTIIEELDIAAANQVEKLNIPAVDLDASIEDMEEVEVVSFEAEEVVVEPVVTEIQNGLSGNSNAPSIEREGSLDDVVTSKTDNDFYETSITKEAANKRSEDLKKEKKSKKRFKNRSKGKYKNVSPSTAYAKTESVVVDEVLAFKDKKQEQQRTMTIETYKVVNYLDEYQAAFDAENKQDYVSNSVAAGYANEADKVADEKALEEEKVEITYKETLEKAIKLYKNQKYTQAIVQFEIILAAHPDEVNGLFYGGLSYYNLKQFETAKDKLALVLTNKETEFNPEANWYNALCLIKLKQIDEAKKVLKEIVAKNGFYKAKAEEKLKSL